MNIRHTPSTVAKPFGPYSHAVEVPEGSRLLYISGEVGVLPDGGEETIRLDATDKRWDVVRAERRDGAGKVLWRVTNDGFKDHGGFRLPDTSDVEEPPHGADAEIKFRSVEPNAELSDDLFRLPPPQGLTAEPADC